MGAGKTSYVKKIKNDDYIKIFDMSSNPRLKDWYKGKYSTYLWEGMCVRWYMEKESKALMTLIENPQLKGVIFDRSTIDCFCFTMAINLTKFYLVDSIDDEVLTSLSNVYSLIDKSVQFIRNVNEGEMYYLEFGSKNSFDNVKTRGRKIETRYEGEDEDWNPSWIYTDRETYDVFCNCYSYSSILIFNLLKKYFDEAIFGVCSNDDFKFKIFKATDNGGIFMNHFQLSRKCGGFGMIHSRDEFFNFNEMDPPLVNIGNFLKKMTNYQILATLIPFHSHPVFKTCDDDYLKKLME